jgi:DNA-directed RNA polymerase subunit M/transcription elongation factor TFIIS
MPKHEQLTPTLRLERKQTFQVETKTEPDNHPLLTNPETEENVSPKTFVMSFCPKCEALLEFIPGKSAEVICRKCKFTTMIQKMRVGEKKINAVNCIRKEIAVLDLEDTTLRTFPIVHTICSECNNGVSETWTMAIGSEGTAGVTFLRCTACGHTRREAE